MLKKILRAVFANKKHCRSAFRVCAAFVFGAFFSCLCAAQNLSKLSQQDFSNRSLQSVLLAYQRAGVPIIFSSALVTDDLIVYYSPPAGDPLVRLRSVLELFKLGLESEDLAPDSDSAITDKTTLPSAWLVVKKPAEFNARLTIINAQTGLPIMNAVIAEQGREAIELGNSAFFYTDVFRDSARLLRVSHNLCQTQAITLAQLKRDNVLALVCDAIPYIEETLVVASFYRWQKETVVSKKNVSRDDITQLPSRGNDPMQTVATLPGMASSGASAKINIRGGASDELLMLFNGVELIEPFHLKDFQGLLSGINSHNVERLDVYSGGYPAQYGSKMSGVIDITPIKPKGKNDNLIELNPIFSALMVAGVPNSEKPENYYIASVRRGHLETTMRAFEEPFGSPRFNDTFLQYHAALNSAQTYDIGLLSIRDDIALQLRDAQGGEQAQSIYSSQYGWLKTTINHSKTLTSEIQLSSTYSKTQREGFLLRTFNNDEDNNAITADANSLRQNGEGSVKDHRLMTLQSLSYLGQWQFEKRQRLTYGGQAQYAKARYDYAANVEHGDLGGLLGLPSSQAWSIAQQPSGVSASGFLSWYSLPIDNLMTEFGVRADLQTYTARTQHQLSPRMALNYQLTNDVALKASAGRFYQASGIFDLDVTNGQNDFYEPQKADHYIVGIDYQIADTLTLGIEGYLKKLFSPRPRAEHLFNPYVLLPELADDRVYLTPSSGTAQGLEMVVDYEPSESLRTWFTFALSEVEDKIQDRIERRGWNQVMAASLGALYDAPSWSLSARWHWHSGWPTTALPAQVSSLTEPLSYTRNNERLPEFLSFDVRLNKNWYPAGHHLEGYLDISNLANRNNIGYRKISVADTPEGYSLNSEAKSLYSIFPVVGLIFHF